MSCPVHAEVESNGCILQAGAQADLEVVHLFPVEHTLTGREDRFDEHTLVPLALGADLEVFGVAVFGVEAAVTQHDHLVLEGIDQALEVRVLTADAATADAHYFAELVEQHKPRLPYDPPAVALAFARAMPLTAPLSSWMR